VIKYNDDFKIGDRVMTNNNCDYPNKSGSIIDISKESIGLAGMALLIALDDGGRIITMEYAVDKIKEELS
jgi:hypothetical protein